MKANMDVSSIVFEPYEGEPIPFTSIYELKSHLGSGGFGDVFEVVRISSGLNMAIKIIDCYSSSLKKIEALKNEAAILQECDHPNIVKFYYLDEYTNYLVMAIELCERGSLKDYISTNIQNKTKIPDAIASKITKEILSAVEYLHNKNIVHRDLKPDNILLHGHKSIESVRICDFGLARVLKPGIEGLISELCGTMMYKAPEQVLGCPYSKGIDIWPCGIMMFEMLNLNRPINCNPKMNESEYISLFKNKGDHKLFFIPPEFENTIAHDFFNRTCDFNQPRRYNASQAQTHPWITRNKEDNIPKSYHEELIKKFELADLFRTVQKTVLFMSIMRDKQSLFKIPDNSCDVKDENITSQLASVKKKSSRTMCNIFSETKNDNSDRINFTENSEVKFNCDTYSSSSDTKVSINDKNTPNHCLSSRKSISGK